MLSRARAQLAVLREAAPVRPDELFVSDSGICVRVKVLRQVFHMIVGRLQQRLDHIRGHSAVHPRPIRPATAPFIQRDHNERLREREGGRLEGTMSKLGAGIFRVCL